MTGVSFQEHGTYLNGTRLAKNKPNKLLGGEKLTFGAHETQYSVSSSGGHVTVDFRTQTVRGSCCDTKMRCVRTDIPDIHPIASGEGGPRMYQALHLLVKHKDVRNPKSWKEPVVSRTEAEALAMIEQFHGQLVTGDPSTLQQRFAELATTESHCSSAKRGGDLGQFGCVPRPCLYFYTRSVALPCACLLRCTRVLPRGGCTAHPPTGYPQRASLCVTNHVDPATSKGACA